MENCYFKFIFGKNKKIVLLGTLVGFGTNTDKSYIDEAQSIKNSTIPI